MVPALERRAEAAPGSELLAAGEPTQRAVEGPEGQVPRLARGDVLADGRAGGSDGQGAFTAPARPAMT